MTVASDVVMVPRADGLLLLRAMVWLNEFAPGNVRANFASERFEVQLREQLFGDDSGE